MARSMRLRRGEDGAAAVEFALIAPVLFLLVFGMIDFGWAINRYAALSNATREGARVASLGGTPTEITNAVDASLNDIGMSDVNVAVTCLKPTGSNCSSYTAGAERGGTAIVTVDFTSEWLTPLASTFGDLNLSKTSRMRIE